MGTLATTRDAGCEHWQPGAPTTNTFSVTASSTTKRALCLKEGASTEASFEGIVGQSSALRDVLKLVEMVANTDSTVLLLGETGTGKELIARAIHNRGRRNARPLVKLNCAAIPSGLLESELFGHERGAFTGAITQKMGRLEFAHQGTLFLDEVGDIPLELQPKLLRLLQEREFERLGSTRTMKVDLRLVAATHRDLGRMMAENQFRSDLYYRLNVFPICIPPLRERQEDIPLLVRYFTDKHARRMGKQIDSVPAGVLRKLMGWHWPGNVRELENVVERSVIYTRGNRLEISVPQWRNSGGGIAPAQGHNFEEQDRVVQILRRLVERPATLTSENMQPVTPPGWTTDDASSTPAAAGDCDERQAIVRILGETKGRVGGPNGAAARLGVKRTTLIARMKKLGIDGRQVLDAHRYSGVEICPFAGLCGRAYSLRHRAAGFGLVDCLGLFADHLGYAGGRFAIPRRRRGKRGRGSAHCLGRIGPLGRRLPCSASGLIWKLLVEIAGLAKAI